MLRVAIIILAVSALCAGCSKYAAGIPVAERAEMRATLRPVFGEPIFIPGSPLVAFPFAAEGDVTGKDSAALLFSGSFVAIGSSASGIGGYSERSGSSSLRWNNLAFYDPATGRSWLLFDEPVLICHFYLPDREHDGPVFGDYLLFGIARDDSNGDGFVNAQDAVVLMASDLRGNRPLRLSPPDAQLVDVAARKDDPEWLYVRLRIDSDGDGRFTMDDRIDHFRVQPEAVLASGEDGEPERILPESLRDEAFEVVLPAGPTAPAR